MATTFYWGYDSSTTTLTLSATATTAADTAFTISTISPEATTWPWHSYRSNITKVRITSKISIGVSTGFSYMFSNFSKLTTINLSNIATEIAAPVRNPYRMFYGCSSLTTVYFPSSPFYVMGNASYMFFNCSSLTNLDAWSLVRGIKISDMSYMFYNCASLTTISLGNFLWDDGYYGTLRDLSHMFHKCSNLISVTGLTSWSDFSTSKVTSLTYMFAECTSLMTLNLKQFKTSNVTDMSYMFYYCTSLKTIRVSDLWSTGLDITGTDMFRQCTALEGQAGTKFSTSHINHGYARIDTPEAPGYFTYVRVAQTAYIMLNGYHYTKPTDPIRTDSARLFIDETTTLEGKAEYDWDLSGYTSAQLLEGVTLGRSITPPSIIYLYYSDGEVSTSGGFNVDDEYWYYFPEEKGDSDSFWLAEWFGGLWFLPEEDGDTLSNGAPLPVGMCFDTPLGDFETWTWTPPSTATLDNELLHLKGIHGFFVKSLENAHVIERIRKSYIEDSTGTLTTNSDGYKTYAPGTGISIGI